MIHSLLLTLLISSPTVKVGVDGEGYLRFARAGKPVYAKEAVLTIADGKLASIAGDPVLPGINVAGLPTSISVDLEGNVSVSGSDGSSRVGRLVLAIFPASTSLKETDGVFTSTERPQLGNPGEDTNGVIRVSTSAVKPSSTTDSKPAVLASEPIGQKGVRITLRPEAKPSGRMIVLGDLADFEGDSAQIAELKKIEIGVAPWPGSKRSLDRVTIANKLQKAGYDMKNLVFVAEKPVIVKGEGKLVTWEQLLETAQLAIAAQGGRAYAYQVNEPKADITVPAGEFALIADAVGGMSTSEVKVVIGIYYMENGQPKLTNNHLVPFMSKTIRFKALQDRTIIKSGSPVKVLMKAGGAVVELSGTAKSQAASGEQISVELFVANQRTRHTGTVVGPGTVEVRV